MSDRLSTEYGGLPTGAPARPATPYKYPAVHDMPPPRSTQPLTEEEQVKLEQELAAARDRQEGREAPAKAAAPGSKNKAATFAVVPPTGAKTAAPGSKIKASTVAVVPPSGARAAAPALNNKASAIAVVPPTGARAAAPALKKKPATVIVVPPAGATANP